MVILGGGLRGVPLDMLPADEDADDEADDAGGLIPIGRPRPGLEPGGGCLNRK